MAARGRGRPARQLHAEALRRGQVQAAGALIISDGAVWIWRLADSLSASASAVGLYRVQHLAAVGQTLFGEDQAKLKVWLQAAGSTIEN